MTFALLAGAALTGVLLAQRTPAHRPVGVYLAVVLTKSVARLSLDALLPAQPGGPSLVGWLRAVFHLDQALYLLSPAGLAAVALVVFARARSSLRYMAIAWLCGSVALCLGYPTYRGDVLRQIYLGAELAALFVGCAAMGRWALRRLHAEEGPPTLAHYATGAIVVADLWTVIAGPWPHGLFGGAWVLAQVADIGLYGALTALQGGALWMFKSSRSS